MNQQHERGILSIYDLKKPFNKFIYLLVSLAILIMVITMIYPILQTFFSGMKPNAELNTFPPKFFPSRIVFKNFKDALTLLPLGSFFLHTIYIFIGNIIFSLSVLSLAAYSLSRMRVPFRKVIFMFLLLALFIPSSTYLIPNYLNLVQLNLLNKFAALWLPSAASAFYLLLIKTFFDSIHPEMFEAARIDGASDFRCFVGIAIPLSVPIYATLTIFIFNAVWNDWFWPNLVIGDAKHIPLASAIQVYVLNARLTEYSVKFATYTIATIPPLIVFAFFQKFILRGVQLGGVKG
ncbi:carbohydrate ABC transporter permease [Paenibacillus psychroresistens]|uniref:Carbohydrate ABC transporter permease n=1 Tax=Paenibacillus psychroresistens TaxID=1778678 RepID=A0A6B8RFV3_9BACL|nr:carbohydrate ABC transporter permease [Paenibacillus psychroresistens]QGQ94382.1 carbohydrate ABC transporter permease [Paenibacillus psychroresistens]